MREFGVLQSGRRAWTEARAERGGDARSPRRSSWIVRGAVALAATFAGASALCGCEAPSAPDDAGGGDASTDGAPTDAARALLPVDCGDSDNVHDPHCQHPIDGSPWSLGSGFSVGNSPGLPQLGGGFVDGHRIVAAAALGSPDLAPGGVVIALDLATGNRTVLSGKYTDPRSGDVMVGTGPDFGRLRDVQPGPDGWYAVSDHAVIRVDPATGNRTMVWNFQTPPGHCTTGGVEAHPQGQSLAVDPSSGAVYLTVAAGSWPTTVPAGVGVVALHGTSCTFVTLAGGPSGSDRGTGPHINQGIYDGLRFHDGALWALNDISASLVRVDPATGNRTVVSSSDHTGQVGSGSADLGTSWLAFGTGTVWTSGPYADDTLLLTEVDPATGDRTEHDASTAGPAISGHGNVVWVHPTLPLLVLGQENGFVLFDPATGASNMFSR